ncbi:hypothetical protein S83_037611 [Arachis hypogaea]
MLLKSKDMMERVRVVALMIEKLLLLWVYFSIPCYNFIFAVWSSEKINDSSIYGKKTVIIKCCFYLCQFFMITESAVVLQDSYGTVKGIRRIKLLIYNLF